MRQQRIIESIPNNMTIEFKQAMAQKLLVEIIIRPLSAIESSGREFLLSNVARGRLDFISKLVKLTQIASDSPPLHSCSVCTRAGDRDKPRQLVYLNEI